jgi:hypothetical protein
LTLVASRYLLAALRRRWAELAERIPLQRWASVLESVASELLQIMTRPLREIKPLLERISTLLRHEFVDPIDGDRPSSRRSKLELIGTAATMLESTDNRRAFR